MVVSGHEGPKQSSEKTPDGYFISLSIWYCDIVILNNEAEAGGHSPGSP